MDWRGKKRRDRKRERDICIWKVAQRQKDSQATYRQGEVVDDPGVSEWANYTYIYIYIYIEGMSHGARRACLSPPPSHTLSLSSLYLTIFLYFLVKETLTRPHSLTLSLTNTCTQTHMHTKRAHEHTLAHTLAHTHTHPQAALAQRG